MRNKILLTSFLPYLSRYCFILGLALLIVVQSCKKENSTSESTPTINTKPTTKVDDTLTFVIFNGSTIKPISNVVVEIITRGGFIRHKNTNDSGRVQFPISAADSGWMDVRFDKNGYSLYDGKRLIDGHSIEYTCSIMVSSYLRCHVVNQVPVSASERIDIFTNKEYKYTGATDITFVEEVEVFKQSIDCKRYWNDVLDSSYSIPLHLTYGDTTDITITF